jgi:hypothetical protein
MSQKQLAFLNQPYTLISAQGCSSRRGNNLVFNANCGSNSATDLGSPSSGLEDFSRQVLYDIFSWIEAERNMYLFLREHTRLGLTATQKVLDMNSLAGNITAELINNRLKELGVAGTVPRVCGHALAGFILSAADSWMIYQIYPKAKLVEDLFTLSWFGI